MATERATAGHLHNGWRMAKVGFWWGLFGIATEAVSVLVFGYDAEGWKKVIAVPLWMAAFGIGGALYSLFLPASARRHSGPAAWVRARTGALAGAVTALPVVAAGVIRSGESIIAVLVPIAAAMGAVFALIAAHFATRPASGVATGGESPRLIDHQP